jgi:hypothetical protein
MDGFREREQAQGGMDFDRVSTPKFNCFAQASSTRSGVSALDSCAKPREHFSAVRVYYAMFSPNARADPQGHLLLREKNTRLGINDYDKTG